GRVGVENFEDLLLVGFRVRDDFLFRQLFASRGTTGWITNHACEIANQEDRGVAQILKVFHFPDKDRVAKVDIRGSRIKPRLYPQRLPGLLRLLQLRDEFLFANDLNRALADVLELVVDGGFLEGLHFVIRTRRPWTSHLPSKTTSIASE